MSTIVQLFQNFTDEIDNLIQFDSENQKLFSARTVETAVGLRKRQLQMLTESIFFSAYRAYESFLRDIFLCYCLAEMTKSGQQVVSYLIPKDKTHAEQLIKSAMPFLDWTSPDTVIARSEIYLQDGFPVKLAYTANKQTLSDLKILRNHIAHNSNESLQNYLKVIKRHYTTVPLSIPTPGHFLLLSEKKNPNKYKLLTYLVFLKDIAIELIS